MKEQSHSLEVPCPLCGSSEWRVHVMAPSHYGPDVHQVTRCTRCGMIFTNPQAAGYLEEVENRGALERHFAADVIERSVRQADFILHLLARFTTARNLLDFGCGSGGLVATALKKGWKACGYDLNGGLVEAARRHWGFGEIFTGPLRSFYDSHVEEFGAIVSYQVFEHLQEPVATGLEVVRMLKPGGILLIDVPNVHQPREWWSKGKTLDPTAHWCHFSLKTLSDLMRRLGCEVLYRSAAPSLVGLYHKMGLGRWSHVLGAMAKAVLPPIGSGVCVIGRKNASS